MFMTVFLSWFTVEQSLSGPPKSVEQIVLALSCSNSFRIEAAPNLEIRIGKVDTPKDVNQPMAIQGVHIMTAGMKPIQARRIWRFRTLFPPAK
jgi:hypothetical protein